MPWAVVGDDSGVTTYVEATDCEDDSGVIRYVDGVLDEGGDDDTDGNEGNTQFAWAPCGLSSSLCVPVWRLMEV